MSPAPCSPSRGDSGPTTGGSSLSGSADPAVVLAGLARSSVEGFSDVCSLALCEGVEEVFRITHFASDPPSTTAAGGSGSVRPMGTVTTTFSVPSEFGAPAYSGSIDHSWSDHDPTPSDRVAAQSLVDLAIATVRLGRVIEQMVIAEQRSATLSHEVLRGRAVGQAVGLVMGSGGSSEREAEDYLRRESRAAGVELWEFAAGVAHGCDQEARTARGPQGRGRLRPVG